MGAAAAVVVVAVAAVRITVRFVGGAGGGGISGAGNGGGAGFAAGVDDRVAAGGVGIDAVDAVGAAGGAGVIGALSALGAGGGCGIFLTGVTRIGVPSNFAFSLICRHLANASFVKLPVRRKGPRPAALRERDIVSTTDP